MSWGLKEAGNSLSRSFSYRAVEPPPGPIAPALTGAARLRFIWKLQLLELYTVVLVLKQLSPPKSHSSADVITLVDPYPLSVKETAWTTRASAWHDFVVCLSDNMFK